MVNNQQCYARDPLRRKVLASTHARAIFRCFLGVLFHMIPGQRRCLYIQGLFTRVRIQKYSWLRNEIKRVVIIYVQKFLFFYQAIQSHSF